MKESDTPETDKETRNVWQEYETLPIEYVPVHFARRLERERNTLKKMYKMQIDLVKALEEKIEQLQSTKSTLQ